MTAIFLLIMCSSVGADVTFITANVLSLFFPFKAFVNVVAVVFFNAARGTKVQL